MPDIDDVRRYETDATRDHDDDASHAETMRREADLLHQMCDDDRDDGLIHLPHTTATWGI